MQHSPRFLNYTTDRVRQHQRLKASFLRDRTRQTPAVAATPEYREAIIAMAKAWMKIAERAKIKPSR
jgi:hypothetical protein